MTKSCHWVEHLWHLVWQLSCSTLKQFKSLLWSTNCTLIIVIHYAQCPMQNGNSLFGSISTERSTTEQLYHAQLRNDVCAFCCVLKLNVYFGVMAAYRGSSSKWFFTREQLESTPSRRCGVEPDRELSYRQQAANLIQDMGQRLNVYPLKCRLVTLSSMFGEEGEAQEEWRLSFRPISKRPHSFNS